MNLYTLTLPDRTTEIASRSGGHETTTAEVLSGSPYVRSTGVSVQSFDIDVRHDGDRRATWRADAFEALGNNPAITPVPLGGCTHAGFDGYYIVSSTRRDPRLAEPLVDEPAASDAEERTTLTLERAGTRKRHTLAVTTSPSQPDPGHPFGNDADAIVGIPAAARRVRLVDSTSEPTVRERPTPVATVDAEHGAVDLFDATNEAVDEPVYLYDLAYELQGDIDPGVWDTYGQAERTDADGVVSWGRVFSTAHDFTGSVVFENGRLRLTIDEPTNADATAALEAETFDAGADSWEAVALPQYPDTLDTQWEPADVDLTHIGQASVRAQVEFEAVAGTNEGEIASAWLQLDRGRDDLFVTETSFGGELPVDLAALLEPIASTSIIDPGVEQGLVAREELR